MIDIQESKKIFKDYFNGVIKMTETTRDNILKIDETTPEDEFEALITSYMLLWGKKLDDLNNEL